MRVAIPARSKGLLSVHKVAKWEWKYENVRVKGWALTLGKRIEWQKCIKETESEKVRVTFPARAKGPLSAPQHSQGDEVRMKIRECRSEKANKVTKMHQRERKRKSESDIPCEGQGAPQRTSAFTRWRSEAIMCLHRYVRSPTHHHQDTWRHHLKICYHQYFMYTINIINTSQSVKKFRKFSQNWRNEGNVTLHPHLHVRWLEDGLS